MKPHLTLLVASLLTFAPAMASDEIHPEACALALALMEAPATAGLTLQRTAEHGWLFEIGTSPERRAYLVIAPLVLPGDEMAKTATGTDIEVVSVPLDFTGDPALAVAPVAHWEPVGHIPFTQVNDEPLRVFGPAVLRTLNLTDAARKSGAVVVHGHRLFWVQNDLNVVALDSGRKITPDSRKWVVQERPPRIPWRRQTAERKFRSEDRDTDLHDRVTRAFEEMWPDEPL